MKQLPAPPPIVTVEELNAYEFPANYRYDVVADGYTGVNEAGTATTWLTKLHVIKPNGRTACNCTISPGKVWNYVSVRAPKEWYDILCDDSTLYLQQEVYRLENASQPAD